jgi:hypothetical protein
MGMDVESDDHYRQLRGGFPPHIENGCFLRSLTPAEEFAGFMQDRVGVLKDSGRLDDTLLWSARSLQFSPEDRVFPPHAYLFAKRVLRQRQRRYPEMEICDDKDFFPEIIALMAVEERAPIMTAYAHHHECIGEFEAARTAYENACRQNFDGNNEQRDLQRFLKKHNLPPKQPPLLPPKNLGLPRRFVLTCKPEHEAAELHEIADYYASRDQPLKAHDALHDLYMFDPSNVEVFQRTRDLRKLPLYQQQFKALFEQQRRILEQQGILRKKTDQPNAEKPPTFTPPKGPLYIINLSGATHLSN